MPIDRSCSTAKTRAVVSNPQVPTRVSCIGAFTFFQSGQRPSPFTRLSYHLSKLPGLTTSPPQLLLLEQLPVVHLDLSSSLGLRFEPLIVLFRLENFRLDSILSLLFRHLLCLVPWHMFMRDDVDEQENEYFIRKSLRLGGACSSCIVESSALTCYNDPTGLHPSRTGWFHDGLDSLRWSRQHVPGAIQQHCDR